MRDINDIIIHCTATPEGRDYTVEQCRNDHVKVNGWSDIGYHFLIYRDGSVHAGRALSIAGAHCSGHNTGSIGVCYVGGMDASNKNPKDTRTEAQKVAIRAVVEALKAAYPKASAHCHYQYNSGKACPSFKISEL